MVFPDLAEMKRPADSCFYTSTEGTCSARRCYIVQLSIRFSGLLSQLRELGQVSPNATLHNANIDCRIKWWNDTVLHPKSVEEYVSHLHLQ